MRLKHDILQNLVRRSSDFATFGDIWPQNWKGGSEKKQFESVFLVLNVKFVTERHRTARNRMISWTIFFINAALTQQKSGATN